MSSTMICVARLINNFSFRRFSSNLEDLATKPVEAVTAARARVAESLKDDIKYEKHRTLVNVQKLQAQLDDIVSKMRAEDHAHHCSSIHKITKDHIETATKLRNVNSLSTLCFTDLTELKKDYEEAKLQILKYNVATVASAFAAGLSWARMMK